MSKELKAGRLWDVWVRHGLLTQDRGRGESPLRHWAHPVDAAVTRQKRLDVMRAQIGSPRAQRNMARRDRRLREIRSSP